ncbi:unnamed protein product [Danaus chrysippus]|uniref:(African queen) hypothetical protein n=1 Tax=Danaus chrysippus TaxID=151541 RepID=A0A8J2R3P9_9NEOP|nr:unnamed protein product [Danaus chrysippus]
MKEHFPQICNYINVRDLRGGASHPDPSPHQQRVVFRLCKVPRVSLCILIARHVPGARVTAPRLCSHVAPVTSPLEESLPEYFIV